MADVARVPVVVPPGGGRPYDMGRMRAVFKADGAETGGRYALFEWWMAPRTAGPPVHENPEDHVFYVLAGVLRVLVGEEWIDAAAGTSVVIPGGVPHGFENVGEVEAGFLTFNVPGGFEARMEGIAEALRS